ncbi:MAG: hypothetical protein E6R09_07260 [Rhodocyclaceae bacterium]|nr:MAG: hypothetical protein E6R09_07260 [Rhodocyclaceae bacterium]
MPVPPMPPLPLAAGAPVPPMPLAVGAPVPPMPPGSDSPRAGLPVPPMPPMPSRAAWFLTGCSGSTQTGAAQLVSGRTARSRDSR